MPYTPKNRVPLYMVKLIQLLMMAGTVLILSSVASARDYELELIVFERTNISSETEEQWHLGSNQGLDHQEALRELASRSIEFPLESGVDRLREVETALLNSGYSVLQSIKWTQPAEFFQQAPAIEVGTTDRLEGFIKVYKTTLIFVDLNLALIDIDSEVEVPSYFINEKRRMKFKEIHYFDHPKFGAIVTVWPESNAD